MRKQIFIIMFLLVVMGLVSGCNHKTDTKSPETQDQQPAQKQNQDQQTEIGLEILETDVDTGDWTKYRSDKFGYSFKLPQDYIFVDEYRGEKLEYNPEETSFFVKKIDSESLKDLLGFSITKENINDFISEYNKESKQENGVVKLFEENEIEFYDKKQSSRYPFPSILHHNSLIIEIGGNIQEDQLKSIINSISFY